MEGAYNCKKFCPKGFKVSQPCGKDTDTICTTCEPNTFMDRESGSPVCYRCSSCKRKEIVYKKCNSTHDTVCKCPRGMVYHPHNPCKACPMGTYFRNNKCHKTALTTTPQKPVKPSDQEILMASLIGSGILLLIIFIVIFIVCYRRRRNRRLPQRESMPDIVNTAVKQPLKVHLGDNGNVYSNIPVPPRQPTTIICPGKSIKYCHKRLSSGSFPFSLMHDLSESLSIAHKKNYKNLAAELGYDVSFVKNLSIQDLPVESLINDYLTTVNPTKDGLVHALTRIGRHDVAMKVEVEL